MNRTLVLAAAAALAAVLLGGAVLPTTLTLWSLTSVGWRLWHATGTAAFVPVEGAKDVYRLDLWWRPAPVAIVPLTAFLVKEGHSWVLVDAGAPDSWSQSYATHLVQALQKALPRGDRLAAILLTHAHPDHTGAIPKLLTLFPQVDVIAHSREGPFLTGQSDYLAPSSMLQSAMQAATLLPHTSVKVPEDRLHVLQGTDGGSLRDHGFSSLSWLPTPGHSPGHVAFLHHPSSTLLAGDALHNTFPSLSFASGLEAIVTKPLAWASAPALRMMLAPARMALQGALTSAGLDSTALGALSSGSLPAGASWRQTTAKIITTATPWSVTALPTPSGEGQVVWTVKPLRMLPGVSVRVAPAFICPKPHCDVERGLRSLCRLAGAGKVKRVLMAHDVGGKGLSADSLAAIAARLPARKGK